MRSAEVASKDAIPTGSVHNSRGDRFVCSVEQVCGDLFVLSWASVRRVCLRSVSFVVFIGGGSLLLSWH